MVSIGNLQPIAAQDWYKHPAYHNIDGILELFTKDAHGFSSSNQ